MPIIARSNKIGFIAALATAGIMSGTAYADAPPSDSWITTKAKIRLMTTDGVKAGAVHVDTVEGAVTLYGKVHSVDSKMAAARAVGTIEGVRKVNNLLQVVPKGDAEKIVSEADDRVKERSEAALKEDPGLASIKVKSVDRGVVLLAGDAAVLSAELRAVRAVASIPGVRRVASEIKVTHEEPDSQMTRVGKDDGSDSRITISAKLRLLANSSVPALDVKVDTDDGVVTLFGMVPTEKAREVAENDVRQVRGVRSVNNELQVVAKAQKERVVAEDDEVKRDVKAALSGNDQFKKIDVDVKNGVVRLSGSVGSPWVKLQAAERARKVPGVRAVENDALIAFR